MSLTVVMARALKSTMVTGSRGKDIRETSDERLDIIMSGFLIACF
jgi:hypothetical protein